MSSQSFATGRPKRTNNHGENEEFSCIELGLGKAAFPHAPWCWNIYQHFPQTSSSLVGEYTILYHTWSRWVSKWATEIPSGNLT